MLRCSIFCVNAAVLRARVRCLQWHVLRPLAFLQWNEDICCLLQSAHFLLFHTGAPAISEKVREVLRPWEISPLVEVKAARPLRV